MGKKSHGKHNYYEQTVIGSGHYFVQTLTGNSRFTPEFLQLGFDFWVDISNLCFTWRHCKKRILRNQFLQIIMTKLYDTLWAKIFMEFIFAMKGLKIDEFRGIYYCVSWPWNKFCGICFHVKTYCDVLKYSNFTKNGHIFVFLGCLFIWTKIYWISQNLFLW